MQNRFEYLKDINNAGNSVVFQIANDEEYRLLATYGKEWEAHFLPPNTFPEEEDFELPF